MEARKVASPKRKKQTKIRVVISKQTIQKRVEMPVTYQPIVLEGSIGSRIIIGLADDKPVFDGEGWVQNVFSK